MSYHKLLNMIEEIKEKLTDNQYKTILEEISSLNNDYNVLKEGKKETYLRLSARNDAIKNSLNRLKDNFISLSVKHFNLRQICENCSCIHSSIESDSDDE